MIFNKFSQTADDFASTYLSRILASGFSIILSILIARFLGPFVKGQLAVIALIGSVCILVGNLGLGSFNMYLVSKDKSKAEKLYVNSFWFSLLISLVSLIAIFILTQFFPSLLKNIPPKHLLIYLASLPFLFLYQIILPLLAGEQKFKLYNFVTVFFLF